MGYWVLMQIMSGVKVRWGWSDVLPWMLVLRRWSTVCRKNGYVGNEMELKISSGKKRVGELMVMVAGE